MRSAQSASRWPAGAPGELRNCKQLLLPPQEVAKDFQEDMACIFPLCLSPLSNPSVRVLKSHEVG